MRRRGLPALLLAAILWLPVAARAVELRSASHPGYGRIVLEFDAPTHYRLSRDGGQVVLSLRTPTVLVPPAAPRNVAHISGGTGRLALSLVPGARLRDSRIGNQIDFHNVEEASDGSEALSKLRGGQFGLVISDWNMQPMTGLQLLQEVRADARLRHLPFIMVTAESKSENVVAAKQAGVSNYIVKPFNAETLKEKIEKVLVHAG